MKLCRLVNVIKILVFLEWTVVDEDQTDIHVWEDNWDDDTVEDDFSHQLRYRITGDGNLIMMLTDPCKSLDNFKPLKPGLPITNGQAPVTLSGQMCFSSDTTRFWLVNF